MVGVVAATALVGGLVGAGTAGASTPSSATKSVQAADSSVRALSATKPGTKCKAKQKGKTLKTKYGKLKCTKTGKKYVWKKVPKKVASPAPAPPALPPPAPVSCAAGGGAAYTCVVGETGPGGGKVFYVVEANPTGGRYMEAAASATSPAWSVPDPASAWGAGACESSGITGAAGTAIGAGSANTTAITAACSAVEAPAAWAAKNYTGGGVSWFLPSKDELNQLCKYARAQSTTVANQAVACDSTGTLQGGFAADFYWSSSQGNALNAWTQAFDSGFQAAFNKNNAFHVRPVRAF